MRRFGAGLHPDGSPDECLLNTDVAADGGMLDRCVPIAR